MLFNSLVDGFTPELHPHAPPQPPRGVRAGRTRRGQRGAVSGLGRSGTSVQRNGGRSCRGPSAKQRRSADALDGNLIHDRDTYQHCGTVMYKIFHSVNMKLYVHVNALKCLVTT